MTEPTQEPTAPDAEVAITVASEPESPSEIGDDAKESRKYRQRAQAAEQERDLLTERLNLLQREKIETLAAQRLGAGADIWSAGTEMTSLLDEVGNVSTPLVDQAVSGILATRPHWGIPSPAAPASTVTASGRIDGDKDAETFQDAFKPRDQR